MLLSRSPEAIMKSCIVLSTKHVPKSSNINMVASQPRSVRHSAMSLWPQWKDCVAPQLNDHAGSMVVAVSVQCMFHQDQCWKDILTFGRSSCDTSCTCGCFTIIIFRAITWATKLFKLNLIGKVLFTIQEWRLIVVDTDLHNCHQSKQRCHWWKGRRYDSVLWQPQPEAIVINNIVFHHVLQLLHVKSADAPGAQKAPCKPWYS